MKKLFILITIVLFIASVFVVPVLAHSGKTDSNGGHWDYSTGTYHYHCGGHPAHQHTGGICPYAGSSIQPTVRPNNPFPTPSKTPSYNQSENEKSNNKDAFVFLAILLGILAFCFGKKAKIEEEKGNISYWGNLFFFATLGAIILGLVALIN